MGKAAQIKIRIALSCIAALAMLFAFAELDEACWFPTTYITVAPYADLPWDYGQIITYRDSDEIDAAYDIRTNEEFKFWYPFNITTYDTAADNIKPNIAAFDAAIRVNDATRARNAAREIINSILDMSYGDEYNNELIRALEFIEVSPLIRGGDLRMFLPDAQGKDLDSLIKNQPEYVKDAFKVRGIDRNIIPEFIAQHPDNPRMPTLRYVALTLQFSENTPDGWPQSETSGVINTTVRDATIEAIEQWHKDYPNHPLSDLVELWKLRVYYFNGDAKSAWKLLLAMYPKHKNRVLTEMRFQVYVGNPPESLEGITDPELITALVLSVKNELSASEREKLWRLSEANISNKWAVNLQERLLMLAAGKGLGEFRINAEAATANGPGFALPSWFPQAETDRPQLWKKLRASLLLLAQKDDEAFSQIYDLEENDEDKAFMLGYLYTKQGRMAMVANTPGVPWSTRAYIIRVLLDDAQLKSIESSKLDAVRREVNFEQGVRLVEQGRWEEAAQHIKAEFPKQAELWMTAAKLSMDKSQAGLLKYARFFKSNLPNIFYGELTPGEGYNLHWIRSINERYEYASCMAQSSGKSCSSYTYGYDDDVYDLRAERNSPVWRFPWSPQFEMEAIKRHNTRSIEYWYALQAYAQWLNNETRRPQIEEQLKEANDCYQWLVGNHGCVGCFWEPFLSGRDEPKILRGRKVKYGTTQSDTGKQP